jgi:hypothetical protein
MERLQILMISEMRILLIVSLLKLLGSEHYLENLGVQVFGVGIGYFIGGFIAGELYQYTNNNMSMNLSVFLYDEIFFPKCRFFGRGRCYRTVCVV